MKEKKGNRISNDIKKKIRSKIKIKTFKNTESTCINNYIDYFINNHKIISIFRL